MLDLEIEEPAAEQEEENMPSFNHSYLCGEILLDLAQNPTLKALPELTLDIDKGLTPDISVYPKEKIRPNFWQDFIKYPEMPIVAIEIVSPTQSIQSLLDKAAILVSHGVTAVWTVEPFGRSVFVVTAQGKEVLHNQEVETAGVKVDFKRIFAEG